MSKFVEIRVNKAIHGLKVGAIKKVKTDDSGTPIDKVWRNRFRDMRSDNCIEIIQPETSAKPIKSNKVKGD